jgi:hypothetical protein
MFVLFLYVYYLDLGNHISVNLKFTMLFLRAGKSNIREQLKRPSGKNGLKLRYGSLTCSFCDPLSKPAMEKRKRPRVRSPRLHCTACSYPPPTHSISPWREGHFRWSIHTYWKGCVYCFQVLARFSVLSVTVRVLLLLVVRVVQWNR